MVILFSWSLFISLRFFLSAFLLARWIYSIENGHNFLFRFTVFRISVRVFFFFFLHFSFSFHCRRLSFGEFWSLHLINKRAHVTYVYVSGVCRRVRAGKRQLARLFRSLRVSSFVMKLSIRITRTGATEKEVRLIETSREYKKNESKLRKRKHTNEQHMRMQTLEKYKRFLVYFSSFCPHRWWKWLPNDCLPVSWKVNRNSLLLHLPRAFSFALIKWRKTVIVS